MFTILGSKRRGKAAGFYQGRGYLQISIDDRLYFAHRIAWLVHYGAHPEGDIDHINGVKDDNRICNLRLVSPAENQMNVALSKRNKSGIVGVHWNNKKSRWVVTIRKETLGYFTDLFEAACARRSAENRLGFSEGHGLTRRQRASLV